jgi:hypothetical protein
MARPSLLSTLMLSVSRDVVAHPRDLAAHYTATHGISRQASNKYIQQLEKEGWIARSGASTRPTYSLGNCRHVSQVYSLKGLQEDLIWSQDFKPYLSLKPNVERIVNHGFTEMVNNAIDHSNSKDVFVYASQTADFITVSIRDYGIGIFEKIARALNLQDRRLALLELSKGKFTTDPQNHSGEGVFFTSRMFDGYWIDANDLKFSHLAVKEFDLLEETADKKGDGTRIMMMISLDSERTTTEVFQAFMNAPDDYDFSKTIIPMRLAQIGDDLLVSRSQAKRLITRFDKFKVVTLDFTGIDSIGQAFADEVFRVYANAYPQVEIVPINMAQEVERMYLRAIAPRS